MLDERDHMYIVYERMLTLMQQVAVHMPDVEFIPQHVIANSPESIQPCVALRGTPIDLRVAMTWIVQSAAEQMVKEMVETHRYATRFVHFQMLTDRLMLAPGITEVGAGKAIMYWPGLQMQSR